VSCFASLGSLYASIKPTPGVLAPDQIIEEESWHTQVKPRELNIPNVIVGNAFVSHFTFYTQWPFFFDVDGTPTNDILERYRQLAKGLNS
jgi:hypothetical protein